MPTVGLRARYNIASVAIEDDRFADAVREVEDALALARERGDRVWELQLMGQAVAPLAVLGRWDQAVQMADTLLANEGVDVFAATFLAQMAAARGDEEMLARSCSVARAHLESTHSDIAGSAAAALARAALERGAADEALGLAGPVRHRPGTAWETVEEAYALCVEAARMLDDEAAMTELAEHVTGLPPARATPLLRAGRARICAELSHRHGDIESSQRHEDEAIGLLRATGARPLLAHALLDRARRRSDDDALAEARGIFAELGATAWLERTEQPVRLAV